jgi:uridine kinase
LAELLARQLSAEVLHTNDFASWDNPKNWWPELIERVLEPIAAGATTLSYPRSKWWPDHHPKPVVSQPVTEVMLLEGSARFGRSFVGIWHSASLWLHPGRFVSLEVNARDAQMGTPKEIANIWEQYYEDEENYIQRDDPERYADVVFEGTRPFEGQLN